MNRIVSVTILSCVFLGTALLAQNSPQKPKTGPKPTATKPKPVAANGGLTTGPGGLPLRGYKFDVVTVDSSGTVTHRRKGQARYYVEDISGVALEMVEISGGSFLMGSTDAGANQVKREYERHGHNAEVASKQSRWEVLRGGSFYHDANHSRAAMRAGALAARGTPSTGFRVVAVARKPPTAAVAVVPAPKRADSPHQKIVFDSNRDGNPEIYVMNPDGSNQQRLTNNKGSDEFPAWSPDGKRIAFASDREGHFEIYVMASDGSNLERLTRMVGEDNVNPAWSPDGKKIAFESDRDGSWEIYVMSVDGSNPLRLTHTKGKGKSSENADWSPDGKRIAFDSDRYAQREIYVVDSDGSNLRQLTRTPGKTLGSEHPVWSPDGKKIAFDSSWDRISKKWEEVTEIYVIQADGSNVQKLTDGQGNLAPVWSPNGKTIVFMSTRDLRSEKWPRSAELYVMDADGSSVRRLTFNKAYDAHPDW